MNHAQNTFNMGTLGALPTFPDQCLEHGHGFLDGGGGVHAVHVVQVYVVSAQPSQGVRQLRPNEGLLAADLQFGNIYHFRKLFLATFVCIW